MTSLFKMDELLWNPLLSFFSVPFFTFWSLFGLLDSCAFLGCIAAYGAHQSLMWRGWGKSNAHSQLMDTVPLGTHSTCLVDSVHYLPWCPTHHISLWTGSPYWRPLCTAWSHEHLKYHFLTPDFNQFLSIPMTINQEPIVSLVERAKDKNDIYVIHVYVYLVELLFTVSGQWWTRLAVRCDQGRRLAPHSVVGCWFSHGPTWAPATQCLPTVLSQLIRDKAPNVDLYSTAR